MGEQYRSVDLGVTIRVGEDLGELPINRHKQEIKEALGESDVVIVVGETGSGKTTQIPLIMLETFEGKGKVAITQPRVMAARSVSQFVAEEVGCKIGEEVGYHVRFDDKTSQGTKVNFMTDGILLRKMQSDPMLSEYMAVMVDEVHERSTNIDFVLGNLKRIQSLRNESGLKPLKVMVTSATLEKEKLSNYFGGAPIVEVKGRTYPVEVHYVEPVSMLLDNHDNETTCPDVTPLVKEIIEKGKEGDILIFEPGVDEINKTIDSLSKVDLGEVLILPIHGNLQPTDQDRIFEESDKRKIIVATNVAEASITVPGVRVVVDTGLVKQMEFDHDTGISSLVLTKQAQDGCIQRTGRAGRVAPGDCYRLYSKENFEDRQKFHLPEIQRSDLAGVVLTMKQMGIEDVETFEFLDPPEKGKLDQAILTLKKLGALDESENVTKLGKEMAELPLEPHLARMVVEAKKFGCEAEVATVVAFLGLKPVFLRFDKEREWEKYRLAESAQGRFKNSSSDFLTLLNVWREYEKNGCENEWARENCLNPRVLREARQVRSQLFGILGVNRYIKREVNDELIGKSIAMGLVENLAENSFSKHGYIRVDSTGNYFVHPSSCLFSSNCQYITVAKVVESTKVYGSFAEEVELEWIAEMVPNMVKVTFSEPFFNTDTGRVEQESVHSWKNGYSYFEGSKVVTGQKATELLAEALTKYSIDDVFADNMDILWEIRDLYMRSNGDMSFGFNEDDLVRIYKERLGNLGSFEEVKRAMSEGKIDMRLRRSDFISEDLVSEVMKKYPDEVEIGGEKYKVRYSQIGPDESKIFSIDVEVPAEKVFKDLRLPDMFLGKTVRVCLSIDGITKRNKFNASDIFEIKEEAKRLLITKQWEKLLENRSRQGESLRTPITLKNGQTVVELPNGIEYGVDPETGKKLLSVPVVTRGRNYFFGDGYFIQHFPTKEEAERNKVTIESQPVLERPAYGLSYNRPVYNPKPAVETVKNKTSLELVQETETDEIIKEIEVLRQRKEGKPRRKALLMAELITRGLDLVEKAKITVVECDDILKELDSARTEALKTEATSVKKQYKDFGLSQRPILEKMIRSVESTRAVLKAVKTESVKDYIGDDPESVKDFQKRLMVLVEKRKEEPKGEELDNLVSDVIEAMTS